MMTESQSDNIKFSLLVLFLIGVCVAIYKWERRREAKWRALGWYEEKQRLRTRVARWIAALLLVFPFCALNLKGHPSLASYVILLGVSLIYFIAPEKYWRHP